MNMTNESNVSGSRMASGVSDAEEDARLAELGYAQRLDRSVGRLASFAIGFATISATTAVFMGFGAGYGQAGGAFVWTLLLAAVVFGVWALIAADLTAKLPLAGYSYQWTTRINNPHLGWFTGFIALVGWISGMTGLGYILSGYLGAVMGWELSDVAHILLAMAVVLVCIAINIWGVKFATLLNNIGVGLELIVTLGGTLLVAVVALSAPDRHQSISALFSGGDVHQGGSYMAAWLASALGPFFGLIGVESSADVSEETRNARYVVPRTMLYAFVASVIIELLMYIVYVLAIRDPQAVLANSGAPIETILEQQLGAVPTKIIVAVAMTNILACLLSNILVATRLTYSMARDNMLPLSHLWRHVSPTRKTPTYAILGMGVLSCLLLLVSMVNAQVFNFIIGIASLAFFSVYILQTAGLLVAYRKGTIPTAEPGTFDLGRWRLPLYIAAMVMFSAVAFALVFLEQFAGNGLVLLGIFAAAALWWVTVLRHKLARGDAGSDYARTHPEAMQA